MRVTESPVSSCAALDSGAEIPAQVQTLMEPPPSLAASTVLTHSSPPGHTALQEDGTAIDLIYSAQTVPARMENHSDQTHFPRKGIRSR